MADNLQKVRLYKRFLLSQFAAECYLDRFSHEQLKSFDSDSIKDTDSNAVKGYEDSSTIAGILGLGSNHYDFFKITKSDPDNAPEWVELQSDKVKDYGSKMFTEGMVKDFASEWQIIDHIGNTSSGFSATLMRNKDGQFTISFRSTESCDLEEGGDAARDQDGANREIAADGFALTRIVDMKS